MFRSWSHPGLKVYPYLPIHCMGKKKKCLYKPYTVWVKNQKIPDNSHSSNKSNRWSTFNHLKYINLFSLFTRKTLKLIAHAAIHQYYHIHHVVSLAFWVPDAAILARKWLETGTGLLVLDSNLLQILPKLDQNVLCKLVASPF